MATVAGNSLVRVTDTVYAAHTPHVNWTLVTGDNAVLLIDAGFPGDRSAVLASLAELGYRPADVAAVLLTHAHVDHFGTAIWLAGEHHVPVYCHADEVGHARRDYLDESGGRTARLLRRQLLDPVGHLHHRGRIVGHRQLVRPAV